jgi:hypothetical protein
MRTVPLNRTPLIGRRTLIWCLACCVIVLLAPAAAASGGRLEIEYTVKVADIPGQLFHGALFTDILDFCARVLAIQFGKALSIDER